MRCPECQSIESEYNDSLGETCCVDCGLVLSWTPIEDTTIVKTPSEHSFERLDMNKTQGQRPFLTNSGLGSHIFPTDKTSKRLAWTQLRASSSYRGGVTEADKHMLVLQKPLTSVWV